jgi:predicted outer membrane repeat protein
MFTGSQAGPHARSRAVISPGFDERNGARAFVRLVFFAGLFASSNAVATTRSFPGAVPCSTTLQACINASGSGDTINIATGTYTLPEIAVGKSLTLNGTGVGLVTLQPDGTHRVLNTAQNLAGGVTLKSLTVSGGHCVSTQTGGGIFAGTGTPLHLDTVDVKNNTCAGNSGGGIFASADATLTDVNVVDNTDPGGAGGGLRAAGNVTIDGGRFENNVSFNPGGGMRVTGTLTMTDVIVLTNSNTASGTNGGGIRADGGLTLTGGTIQGNTAANFGGGVYATAATISGATFQSNSAKQGGGVYVTGTLAVTDTLFDGNTATTATAARSTSRARI